VHFVAVMQSVWQVLQCVAVMHSVWQSVAVCCIDAACGAVCRSVVQFCSVLQCVAACCRVLQCVAGCCNYSVLAVIPICLFET